MKQDQNVVHDRENSTTQHEKKDAEQYYAMQIKIIQSDSKQ